MKNNIIIIALISSGLQAKQDTQNLHRYLLANYYQFGHDYKNAGYWYAQIHPDQTSVHIYNGYIPYLAATGAHSEIGKRIPQLEEPMANN
ncbi:hypothetical protein BH09DEP1_BH09DEP1_5260 [soil metagenome]